MSTFKFGNVIMNLGGHEVTVSGDFEFTEELTADTVAGALLVEDRRNQSVYPKLEHTEVIDGRNVSVSYGINAERIVTDLGAAPEAEAEAVVEAPVAEAFVADPVSFAPAEEIVEKPKPVEKKKSKAKK